MIKMWDMPAPMSSHPPLRPLPGGGVASRVAEAGFPMPISGGTSLEIIRPLHPHLKQDPGCAMSDPMTLHVAQNNWWWVRF